MLSNGNFEYVDLGGYQKSESAYPHFMEPTFSYVSKRKSSNIVQRDLGFLPLTETMSINSRDAGLKPKRHSSAASNYSVTADARTSRHMRSSINPVSRKVSITSNHKSYYDYPSSKETQDFRLYKRSSGLYRTSSRTSLDSRASKNLMSNSLFEKQLCTRYTRASSKSDFVPLETAVSKFHQTLRFGVPMSGGIRSSSVASRTSLKAPQKEVKSHPYGDKQKSVKNSSYNGTQSKIPKSYVFETNIPSRHRGRYSEMPIRDVNMLNLKKSYNIFKNASIGLKPVTDNEKIFGYHKNVIFDRSQSNWRTTQGFSINIEPSIVQKQSSLSENTSGSFDRLLSAKDRLSFIDQPKPISIRAYDSEEFSSLHSQKIVKREIIKREEQLKKIAELKNVKSVSRSVRRFKEEEENENSVKKIEANFSPKLFQDQEDMESIENIGEKMDAIYSRHSKLMEDFNTLLTPSKIICNDTKTSSSFDHSVEETKTPKQEWDTHSLYRHNVGDLPKIAQINTVFTSNIVENSPSLLDRARCNLNRDAISRFQSKKTDEIANLSLPKKEESHFCPQFIQNSFKKSDFVPESDFHSPVELNPMRFDSRPLQGLSDNLFTNSNIYPTTSKISPCNNNGFINSSGSNSVSTNSKPEFSNEKTILNTINLKTPNSHKSTPIGVDNTLHVIDDSTETRSANKTIFQDVESSFTTSNLKENCDFETKESPRLVKYKENSENLSNFSSNDEKPCSNVPESTLFISIYESNQISKSKLNSSSSPKESPSSCKHTAQASDNKNMTHEVKPEQGALFSQSPKVFKLNYRLSHNKYLRNNLEKETPTKLIQVEKSLHEPEPEQEPANSADTNHFIKQVESVQETEACIKISDNKKKTDLDSLNFPQQTNLVFNEIEKPEICQQTNDVISTEPTQQYMCLSSPDQKICSPSKETVEKTASIYETLDSTDICSENSNLRNSELIKTNESSNAENEKIVSTVKANKVIFPKQAITTESDVNQAIDNQEKNKFDLFKSFPVSSFLHNQDKSKLLFESSDILNLAESIKENMQSDIQAASLSENQLKLDVSDFLNSRKALSNKTPSTSKESYSEASNFVQKETSVIQIKNFTDIENLSTERPDLKSEALSQPLLKVNSPTRSENSFTNDSKSGFEQVNDKKFSANSIELKNTESPQIIIKNNVSQKEETLDVFSKKNSTLLSENDSIPIPEISQSFKSDEYLDVFRTATDSPTETKTSLESKATPKSFQLENCLNKADFPQKFFSRKLIQLKEYQKTFEKNETLLVKEDLQFSSNSKKDLQEEVATIEPVRKLINRLENLNKTNTDCTLIKKRSSIELNTKINNISNKENLYTENGNTNKLSSSKICSDIGPDSKEEIIFNATENTNELINKNLNNINNSVNTLDVTPQFKQKNNTTISVKSIIDKFEKTTKPEVIKQKRPSYNYPSQSEDEESKTEKPETLNISNVQPSKLIDSLPTNFFQSKISISDNLMRNPAADNLDKSLKSLKHIKTKIKRKSSNFLQLADLNTKPKNKSTQKSSLPSLSDQADRSTSKLLFAPASLNGNNDILLQALTNKTNDCTSLLEKNLDVSQKSTNNLFPSSELYPFSYQDNEYDENTTPLIVKNSPLLKHAEWSPNTSNVSIDSPILK